jgi:hypothetical protein
MIDFVQPPESVLYLSSIYPVKKGINGLKLKQKKIIHTCDYYKE